MKTLLTTVLLLFSLFALNAQLPPQYVRNPYDTNDTATVDARVDSRISTSSNSLVNLGPRTRNVNFINYTSAATANLPLKFLGPDGSYYITTGTASTNANFDTTGHLTNNVSIPNGGLGVASYFHNTNSAFPVAAVGFSGNFTNVSGGMSNFPTFTLCISSNFLTTGAPNSLPINVALHLGFNLNGATWQYTTSDTAHLTTLATFSFPIPQDGTDRRFMIYHDTTNSSLILNAFGYLYRLTNSVINQIWPQGTNTTYLFWELANSGSTTQVFYNARFSAFYQLNDAAAQQQLAEASPTYLVDPTRSYNFSAAQTFQASVSFTNGITMPDTTGSGQIGTRMDSTSGKFILGRLFDNAAYLTVDYATPGSIKDYYGNQIATNDTVSGASTKMSVLGGTNSNFVSPSFGPNTNVVMIVSNSSATGPGVAHWFRTTNGVIAYPPYQSINLTNGNVGIGTNAPDTALVVRGSGGNLQKIIGSGNGYLSFYTDGGTTRAGYVGYGSDATTLILNNDAAGNIRFVTASGRDIDFQAGGTTGAIYVNGITRSVGIGTTTPSASLDVTGRVSTTVGSSTNKVRVGGTLTDFTTDAANATTAETDLYSFMVQTNTLSTDKDKITFEAAGDFTGGTPTKQLKVYLSGTAVFDSGALGISSSASWHLRGFMIRSNATVVRSSITLNTSFASLSAYSQQADVSGLTLTTTNIFRITGTSAGVGAASGDIVANQGTIDWKPAGPQ